MSLFTASGRGRQTLDTNPLVIQGTHDMQMLKLERSPDLADLLTKFSSRPPVGKYRLYAITFDLDTETLQKIYPGDSWRNAYGEIKRILLEEGFDWQQGSVYFGNPDKIDAVRCMLAAQRLAEDLPWFAEVVRDIRMLRIEENNNLGPAVDKVRRLIK
jgi:virulence-associated protein VapD